MFVPYLIKGLTVDKTKYAEFRSSKVTVICIDAEAIGGSSYVILFFLYYLLLIIHPASNQNWQTNEQ